MNDPELKQDIEDKLNKNTTKTGKHEGTMDSKKQLKGALSEEEVSPSPLAEE